MFTKLVSVHAWRDVAEKTPWPAWWLVGSRGPPPAKPDRKLKVDVKPTAGTDNQCTQWLQTVCTQAKGLARRPNGYIHDLAREKRSGDSTLCPLANHILTRQSIERLRCLAHTELQVFSPKANARLL